MKFIDLVAVILRLLAIWMFITAAISSLNAADALFAAIWSIGWRLSFVGVQQAALASHLVIAGLYMLTAVVFFFLAPRIARRICLGLDSAAATVDITRIRAGQAYHIAMIVTGIVVLCDTFPVIGEAVARYIVVNGRITNRPAILSPFLIIQFLVIVARVAVAILLIVSSKQIGSWLASLRYDPDNVPAQRVSLRVLLFLVVVSAIILLLVRAWL